MYKALRSMILIRAENLAVITIRILIRGNLNSNLRINTNSNFSKEDLVLHRAVLDHKADSVRQAADLARLVSVLRDSAALAAGLVLLDLEVLKDPVLPGLADLLQVADSEAPAVARVLSSANAIVLHRITRMNAAVSSGMEKLRLPNTGKVLLIKD